MTPVWDPNRRIPLIFSESPPPGFWIKNIPPKELPPIIVKRFEPGPIIVVGAAILINPLTRLIVCGVSNSGDRNLISSFGNTSATAPRRLQSFGPEAHRLSDPSSVVLSTRRSRPVVNELTDPNEVPNELLAMAQ